MRKINNFLFKRPKLNYGDKIKDYYNALVLNIEFDWKMGDWMILVRTQNGRHYISRTLLNFYIN